MTEQQEENPCFLTDQLITYLGNKRNLLPFIGEAVGRIRKRTGQSRHSFFDVFSGSGVVSRYFKKYASLLAVNDLEPYAAVINRCYLANSTVLDEAALRELYSEISGRLDTEPLVPGIISGLYAPQDDTNIRKDERVFYTSRNARYLDTARSYISSLPEQFQDFFLAPLLSEASIHANTAGVFKGFYKNRETGVGQFGGKNRDALSRICGDIRLQYPVFSNFECETHIFSGDANEVCAAVPEVDIAYIDPPYNQHPYGSNYFMLNLLTDYRVPEKISPVSGIPENWKRSRFNRRQAAVSAFTDLVEHIRAKYLVVSFNSEGFISLGEMQNILTGFGALEILEIPYTAFRGSRNLNGRNIHVTEYLYILEKK
ncbi:DNA adenine methylase [Brucepastera parasyntrophica]|uniref:DNA adenine methylase n=1 Tax=Brucepastera parasyntrophica TaxID=2880008 RepID=UPI002108BE27|nr:DNA adenine methylase [Brucepastera parasyntrophica]ULQ58762.1 DNA adenine methylase [Brucepastera parasyntrophica]